MRKQINFVIDCQIYPYDIMVSIGEDDKTLHRKMKRVNVEGDYSEVSLEGCQGRCVMFKRGEIILRLKTYPKTPTEYGNLAHEVFHAAEFLLRRINMPLTYESDEAYAYLIGYITEEIYKKI